HRGPVSLQPHRLDHRLLYPRLCGGRLRRSRRRRRAARREAVENRSGADDMTAATDATIVPTRVPWLALVSRLLVQAFVTMAAYSMSVVAPEVAAELGIEGSTIGLSTALVYGFGMLSAVASPGFIRRFGAIRTCQFSLLVASAGLAVAAFGATALIV